jgi:hypothetical protein
MNILIVFLLKFLLINSSSINNLKNKIKYGKTLVKLVALNLKYKFWDILIR